MRAVRRGLRAWALALGFTLAAALPAGADFEAGQRAWDAGRAGDAVAAWQSAAEAGDSRSMLALGRAYAQGVGTLRDLVEAHKWLNLAASFGSAEAAAARDALAREMTVEERAEARKLARAWRNREGERTTARPAPRETPAAEAPAGPPPKRALREAQGLLAALGYDPGPADGIWGRRSAEAYRGFLRDAGLEAADTLTPAALQAMRRIARERNAAPARPPANLHRLVQAGDVDGLEAALADGGARKIDARDGRGWTALMHAADKGYALLVPPLVKAGADVDLRAPDGATALFIAAVHGHSEVTTLLMSAGADANIKGPGGRTAAGLIFTPGKSFSDCAECPEMVVVPAGSFTMGSPASEEGRYDDEGPQHRVTISQPFAVGRYEVTFSEWDACVSAGGCNRHRPDDEGCGRGRRPVMNVSWDDAKSYVSWLSRKTGKRYRLLTEAEWEYAARAGTTGPFHFGNTISTDRANYDGNYTYGPGRKGVYREKTVPVGSFPANRFGLHDVHGNVWEWVEDCWHDSYAGAPSDGSAWTTGGECSDRVLRGGSWIHSPRYLRSAFRVGYGTGVRYDVNGFRVARTLAP